MGTTLLPLIDFPWRPIAPKRVHPYLLGTLLGTGAGMPRRQLTDRFRAHAKAREGDAQTDYFDEQTSGLALRESRAGQKSWTYHFTWAGKRSRPRQEFDLAGWKTFPPIYKNNLARRFGSGPRRFC